MRALVPVAVVAIIAVTVLVIWLTARRRAVKREELADARRRVRHAEGVLTELRKEARVQVLAGNPSHAYSASVLDAYFDIPQEIS